MDKQIVILAFLRPLEDDPILNRITAVASRHPFCHVKLILNPYKSTPLGFSVQLGQTVTLRPTKLANPSYTTLSVAIDTENHTKLKSFCDRISRQNMHFDNLGMYLSYIHPGLCFHTPSEAAGATFCSKIICEALKAAGVPEVSDICPSACTPSMLFSAFKESTSQVVGPIRMGALTM
jgi:hypothetical protein